MGGCANRFGRAPKKFVDIFFREERLPVAEGWSRPEGDDVFELLMKMRDEIGRVSEWSPTPGQYPWVILGPGAPEDPMKAGTIL
ncbi:hypothetical protein WG66_007882 [Moniliophthora roreri]|nr:hypothetical protein WG66_007882 [Moniliophthora roreri]